MISQEENELLTKIGPGTPCGELMRRYWHPIAPAVHLDENPVRRVRILGEDLTLYRDRSGTLGLIGDRCPHRMMDMQFGIPEETGLRCPYHGWLYDETGTCLETPLEPPDSRFKEKVPIKNYRVQELGGLIFAYMGPEPAPLLPRWDLFIRPHGFRQIVGQHLPCNWLQVMENRSDIGHGTYLHGRLFQYGLERRGLLTDDPEGRYNGAMAQQVDRLSRGVYVRYRLNRNEFGFAKGNLESDRTEDEPSWIVGNNPVFFPYQLSFGPGVVGMKQMYQIGVPVDDTTTWHFTYYCFTPPDEIPVPSQSSIPYAEVPLKGENGEYDLTNIWNHDTMSYSGQGLINDRTKEHLAVSDACVIEYRKLLREQIRIVEDGGEPMNIFRDATTVDSPELRLPLPRRQEEGDYADNTTWTSQTVARSNLHRLSKGGWPYMDDDAERYCPDRDVIMEMSRKVQQLWEHSQSNSSKQ